MYRDEPQCIAIDVPNIDKTVSMLAHKYDDHSDLVEKIF